MSSSSAVVITSVLLTTVRPPSLRVRSFAHCRRSRSVAMRGVVFDEDGVHVRDDIELRSPAADEVVVRLLAAGVCQSDVKVFTRVTRLPLPLVMGHEGAGIVESIGSAVDSVAPGDFVVL